VSAELAETVTVTRTGVGTIVAEKAREIDVLGKRFLLELPISADFALLAAHRADYYGNLDYALTARNFNPIIAMAGSTVIADAEHIVPGGLIAPDHVLTPAPLVDYIVANA
jgi:acetate CoA/acetoacetate CoA-transferase alpha subunit